MWWWFHNPPAPKDMPKGIMTATIRLLPVVDYKLITVLKRLRTSEAWYLASSAPPAE
jgi:hypothetical protein